MLWRSCWPGRGCSFCLVASSRLVSRGEQLRMFQFQLVFGRSCHPARYFQDILLRVAFSYLTLFASDPPEGLQQTCSTGQQGSEKVLQFQRNIGASAGIVALRSDKQSHRRITKALSE